MSESVDERIARARQRLRSASSDDERRAALLDECDASLVSFQRAARASAVEPAVRLARVRLGEQRIESAVQELVDLSINDRRSAVDAMRWLSDPTQLRAVVAALRSEIDDLRWIERCGALGDRALAVEIAASSTRDLPAVIEALFVHLGPNAAATFEDKARAARSMIEQAGTADEIAWMAGVVLALPPEEARPIALDLRATLDAIEREGPAYLWELDDPDAAPLTRLALALAHSGEHALAAEVIARCAESIALISSANAPSLRRALSLLAPEAAAALSEVARLHELDRPASADALNSTSSRVERVAFDPRATREALREITALARRASLSAASLAMIDATVPWFIESLTIEQRATHWDAIERCVDRGFIEAARVLALAPSDRLRPFVERRFDSLGGLRVIAEALRAMQPGADRAWLARTSIQRDPAGTADEGAEFAIATALDDDEAALRWLRERHPTPVSRGALPPSALMLALERAAELDEPQWWTTVVPRVLVAHLRHTPSGRELLARCASRAIEACRGTAEARATLEPLLRYADAAALPRAVALQSQQPEWWLGHALIVRSQELRKSARLTDAEHRAMAREIAESLSFVPRSTLTAALAELAAGSLDALADRLAEPPVDRARWTLVDEARAFSIADLLLAWGAFLPGREALDHGTLLWSLASEEARSRALPWVIAGYRSQRTTGAQVDSAIIARLPLEQVIGVWAKYGPGSTALSMFGQHAELRRMGGAATIDAFADHLFAALDAI